MRNIIAGAFILFVAAQAHAQDFNDSCENMRNTVVSLSQNLRTINSSEMKLASDLQAKGGQSDLKAYNQAVEGIADQIDALTYKIDQSCK